MTCKSLEFEEELTNSINMTELVQGKQDDIWERSLTIDNDGYFNFYKANEIAKMILDKLDFWYIDTLMINTSVYWCGMLTAEPWDELGCSEETIANWINEYHLEIVLDKTNNCIIRFKNNSKSPLYRFFRKYRDGYGENISYSLDSIFMKIKQHMEYLLDYKTQDYGTWEELELDDNIEDWEE